MLGLRGANAREVVDGVRAKLVELAPSLPQGVTTRVFYDRGGLVERAVGTVSRALAEASALVLVLTRWAGMSANLMSLGGLAIAIGMLVAAAVVVVENIVTELSKTHDGSPLPRLNVIYRASREVTAPVTSGILIIVIVFLPLLTLQGLEGKLFVPIAMTIVFALSASLLLLPGPESVRESAALFAGKRLPLPGGATVPLADVAQLVRADAPVKIDHEDARRMVVVQANVRGRDLVGFVEEARRVVDRDVPLPAGYSAAWGGQFENQQHASQRLALVVPLALALIFVLLFASGPGSEIQRPLAIVVIGGLASSTLLTLVMLPILYRRFAVAPAAR